MLWVTSVEGCRQARKVQTLLMNLHADSLPEISGLGWRTGEACVARYLDGAWHRAKVLQSAPPNILVQFVDFGTELTLHQDQLRRKVQAVLDVPSLAFPVRLNIKPKSGQWEEETLNFIHHTAVASEATFNVLRPDREGWLVDMEIVQSEQGNFGNFLVMNGLCEEGGKVVDSYCRCLEILKLSHYLPQDSS